MKATLVDPENRTTPSKDQLIADHMELVRRIARHYSRNFRTHYDDLVQVGSIGLLRAIERYDPTRQTRFKTYASHLITSEIRHYLRDQVAVVRFPRDLQELIPRLRQAEQVLRQQFKREPELPELADHLGVSEKKIQEVYLLETNHTPVSLDQAAFQRGQSRMTIAEQIEDKDTRSFHLAQDDRILLQDSLSRIKGQSRQIIEFAFYQDLTQTEIAKHLGISQMQVSRRLRKAMGELWETLNTRVTPW